MYYDNYNNVCTIDPIFFEMDNVLGERENFVVDDPDNDKTMTYSQQVKVETECITPCPPTAEMCIAMCA